VWAAAAGRSVERGGALCAVVAVVVFLCLGSLLLLIVFSSLVPCDGFRFL
jgi:hypothetical protein